MSTSITSSPVTAPFPELNTYWEAAEAQRFILPECQSCGQVHWYPRMLCPHCGSDKISWRVASGKGSIYSYSILRRAAKPYVLAYIQLEEGPRMLSNIVACDVETLFIGQEVRVAFEAAPSGMLVPMFAPMRTQSDGTRQRTTE